MTCGVCGKGDRARLFCQRETCPKLMAMPDLPRPDVEVVTNGETGATHVVISRAGKGRSYEVGGATTNEKIQDAVRRVIADPYTGEWLPRR